MQSFHFVSYCYEKWDAQGLCSDGHTSNRTVTFQKNGTTTKVIREVERYAIVPSRSRLHRQIENISTERLRSRLNTEQNWYAIVSFPHEQPICHFQKLGRRWNGTIAFPCELGLSLFTSRQDEPFLFYEGSDMQAFTVLLSCNT